MLKSFAQKYSLNNPNIIDDTQVIKKRSSRLD